MLLAVACRAHQPAQLDRHQPVGQLALAAVAQAADLRQVQPVPLKQQAQVVDVL